MSENDKPDPPCSFVGVYLKHEGAVTRELDGRALCAKHRAYIEEHRAQRSVVA